MLDSKTWDSDSSGAVWAVLWAHNQGNMHVLSICLDYEMSMQEVCNHQRLSARGPTEPVLEYVWWQRHSGALKTRVSGGSSAERSRSLTATTRFLVSAQSSPVERRAAEGLTHCSRVQKLSSSWLNRSLLMHFICAELKALKDFFSPNQLPTNCSDMSKNSRNHLPDYFTQDSNLITTTSVCKPQICVNLTFLYVAFGVISYFYVGTTRCWWLGLGVETTCVGLGEE